MRYKEGEIPPELLTVNASDDMLLLTSVMGVVIGIILFVLGRYGKQQWMWVWAIGLVIISTYMGLSIKYDLAIFGPF